MTAYNQFNRRLGVVCSKEKVHNRRYRLAIELLPCIYRKQQPAHKFA